MSEKIFQINEKEKIFPPKIKQVNITLNQILAKTIQQKNDRTVSLINMDLKNHKILMDSMVKFFKGIICSYQLNLLKYTNLAYHK